MKIYFSRSVRGGDDDYNIYTNIMALLENYGEVLSDHKKIREENTEVDNVFVYNRDVNWIKISDIMVAEVSTPSLGVGYEIAYAELLSKKIICLYRYGANKKLSSMIAGNSNIQVINYNNVEELKDIFDKYLK